MSEGQQNAALQPESAIAQSFSADLDDMFGLKDDSAVDVDTLSQTVEAKKQTVTSGEQELQQLEARLRETEQRLARVSRGNSPARAHNTTSSNTTSSNSTTSPFTPRHSSRLPTETPEQQASTGATLGSSPLAQQKPTYPADRPPTGGGGGRPQNVREDTQTLMAGMPGALPQTPGELGGGRGEYVMVDRRVER